MRFWGILFWAFFIIGQGYAKPSPMYRRLIVCPPKDCIEFNSYLRLTQTPSFNKDWSAYNFETISQDKLSVKYKKLRSRMGRNDYWVVIFSVKNAVVGYFSGSLKDTLSLQTLVKVDNLEKQWEDYTSRPNEFSRLAIAQGYYMGSEYAFCLQELKKSKGIISASMKRSYLAARQACKQALLENIRREKRKKS